MDFQYTFEDYKELHLDIIEGLGLLFEIDDKNKSFYTLLMQNLLTAYLTDEHNLLYFSKSREFTVVLPLIGVNATSHGIDKVLKQLRDSECVEYNKPFVEYGVLKRRASYKLTEKVLYKFVDKKIYKKCGKCEDVKLISEFSKNSKGKHAVSSTCKRCRNSKEK